MTELKTTKKKTYSSFNGLSREPMVMGAPTLVTVGCFLLGFLLGVIGSIILGNVGMLFGLPLLPIFLFIRTLSQTDDQAVKVFLLEMKFYWKYRVQKRMNYKANGNAVTFTTTGYTNNERDYRYTFEQPTRRTGRVAKV